MLSGSGGTGGAETSAGGEQRLKRELQQRFGAIGKLVTSAASAEQPASAYVTFVRREHALACILGLKAEGQKASLGTTKYVLYFLSPFLMKSCLLSVRYCNHWLRCQACPKKTSGECKRTKYLHLPLHNFAISLCTGLYLHSVGSQEASFSKQAMKDGKHFDYEKRFPSSLCSLTLKFSSKFLPPTIV